MSEERKEILRMLSEGIIKVDDAEKLLHALDEGERKRAEADRNRPRTFRHVFKPGSFNGIGETLAGIGPVIHDAINEAMEGVQGVVVMADPEEGGVPVSAEGGTFDVPSGASLVIRNRGHRHSRGGDLSIHGAEGGACRFEGPGAGGVRVYRMGDKYILSWPEDDIEVYVPDSAADVSVALKGGDVSAAGVKNRLSVKTMGGDIDLAGVVRDFSVTTMGGDVSIRLDQAWKGQGEGSTMGGDIDLEVPCGTSARIGAVTMGGSIDLPADASQIAEKKSIPGRRAEIVLGPSDAPESSVRLKTMGGDIDIREA
jgi:hypothetical protein